MSGLADIYISFSAADNQDVEGAKGWVSHLEAFLSLFLKNLLGREINIILDDDETKEAKAKSFIYIVSQNHITSSAAIGKLKAYSRGDENTQAIFKVLKSNIASAKQPSELAGFYPYNLFDEKDEHSALFESSTESATWLRLVDLAYDLFNQISEDDADKVQAKSSKSVFLAEVSEEQKGNRDIISRELQMHGYEVFPKKHLSTNAEDIIQQVNDYLSKSSLAIHIIGENPGFMPEGSDVSIVELQNSIAAQYSEKIYNDHNLNNDFTRLIWISPEIEFENEQQKMEVERLKQDMSALRGAEVILSPVEMFKTIIMLRLNETFESVDEAEVEKSSKKVVYLIYEKAFQENILPVEKVLNNSGITTVHPLFEGDQIQLINKHRTNLIDCDATLIYYHEDNEHWIESKVKEFKKSPGFGRKKPYLANVVLKPEAIQVSGNKLLAENLEVIDIKGEFKEEILNPFLDKLKN